MSEPRFVIALSAEVPAEGLVRIPLAKLGTWWKGKLKFSITRADMASLVANFRDRAADLVVDYEHSTEYKAAKGEESPAAGWLKAIEDGPDESGVLWGQAEFTEKARGYVAAKEYKYISPVIVWGKRDIHSGVQQGATFTSIALTNVPLLEEMPALALSEIGWSEGEEKAMVKKLILADRAAGTVRVVLDDNTETTLSLEGFEPGTKVVRMSDIKRDANGKPDFASVAAEGGALLASEVVSHFAIEGELDEAVRAGKITPAQRPMYAKLAASDLEGFRGLVKTMKPQVPLGERGVMGTGDEQLDEDKVDGRINELVQQKLAANDKLTPGEAFKVVMSENPALAERKRKLMRQ